MLPLQLLQVSDQCFGLALSPGGLMIAVVSLLMTIYQNICYTCDIFMLLWCLLILCQLARVSINTALLLMVLIDIILGLLRLITFYLCFNSDLTL